MRTQLAERAQREGVGLRMVGVTNHWSADSGGAHLKEYGSFDEVTVGSNWLNSAIATLVWRDGHTSPSVPQVLIHRHSVTGGPGLRFGPPEVIEQVKGWDAIRDWGLNQTLVP
jgi:hypothetical protein